jgi:NAD dependent epimerase/dehydratase family enzyme
MFGEMTSLLTDDQNIFPLHLLAGDFCFKYPEITEALENLL